MDSNKDLPDLTSEEKLQIENDFLKAKLTAEFGMKHSSSSSSLDSEMENQWLNHIYDFEKSYTDAGTISIYDFLDKPEFKSIDKLSKEEITSELERLYEIMSKNGIVLDTLCEYEDEVIYKFITEEFFQKETDNMRIEGMNHCFIYEEFHPNHEYDLTNQSDDFIHSLIEKEWDKEFDKYSLDEKIKFMNTDHERDTFMEFILTFQEVNKPLKIESSEINKVEFDLNKGLSEVSGNVSYKTNQEKFSGEFIFQFKHDDGFWAINGVKIPNFG